MNNEIVLILGVDHCNTLGLIRSLGEVGLKPIVFIMEGNNKISWTLKSKYVDKKLSRIVEVSNVISSLMLVGKALGRKIFLIPSCDKAVQLISDNSEELNHCFYIPQIFEGRRNLKTCLDKEYSNEIALASGFLLPESMCFQASDWNSIRDAIKTFEGKYPLIIKEENALIKKSHCIIQKEEEITSLLSEYGDDKVVLQQFLIKDEEIGIQGVGFGDGSSFIPASIHKIRTSSDSMGSTTYAIIQEKINERLKRMCCDFIKKIKYYGIFDIEVIKKGDNFYFVECNYRNGAYGYAYTKMGFNLPMILISKRMPNSCGNKQMYLMNEFSDYKSIKYNGVGILNWIMNFLKSKIKLTIQIKDMMPFYSRVMIGIRQSFLRINNTYH